jgi:WD40 repeat protein
MIPLPAAKAAPLTWRQVGLSTNGKTLAYSVGAYGSAEARVVQLYEVDTGRHEADLRHEVGVSSLVWMPDGRTLATGCIDTNEIHVWDVTVRPPQVVRKFTSQKGGHPYLGVNRTGDLLASTTMWGRGLRLWHPRTGQELLHFPGSALLLCNHAEGGRLWGTLDGKQSKHIWEAVPPRAYLTLTRGPGSKPEGFRHLSVSPDGRLIAAGVEGGVALWDSVNCEERGFLDLGGKGTPWFAPHSGDLFTNNPKGLWRWPLRWLSAERVRLGPPEQWTSRGHFDCAISGSLDGRLIAVSGWPYSKNSLGIAQGPPRRTVNYGPHVGVRHLSVSPDGRYVVTAPHDANGAKVWDAASGQLVHEWPRSDAWGWKAEFSRDGRWLLTSAALVNEQTSECKLWEVGSWHLQWSRQSEGAIGLDPDSRMAVLSEGEGRLCLVALSSGRALARLEDPNQGRTKNVAFSPDGSKILASSSDNQALHIWDLRLLRRELRELALDWDAPPYPPEERAGAIPGLPRPLEIQIIGTK